MIRKFALLILAACGLWTASVNDGVAQATVSELYLQCTDWNRPSFDKPGARFSIYPYLVDMRTELRGQVMGDPPISGTFHARGAFVIAVWSEPDGDRPTLQFTTPYGIQMEFVSDDRRTKYLVREGRLSELPPLLPPLLCPNDEKPRPGVASPSRRPYVTKRVEVPIPKGSEEPEERGLLEELIKKHSKGTEPPDAGKRKSFNELAQELKRPSEPIPPPEAPAAKTTTPPRKDVPPGPSLICGLDFKHLPGADDLKETQTVGLRNNKKEAEAYDYLPEVADAVALNAVADMAGSTKKFVPYEAVGRQGDKLWVSVRDSGALRVKPGYRKPPPPVSVRVIVAGGAAEVALSGLDAVGAELSKQPERPHVAVEWYPVNDTGSLDDPQHYESFEDLIKAADERKGDGRPIPLGEIEIRALLDKLQSVLIAQEQPVDRVFWIKGAYMVPSAIPARFEEFIEMVTRNSAPVRSSGEWLTVVTARMPGFSIGYLKAPVTSKNVGDVIEEPIPELKPRRFIDNPKVLAARLWARANARAAAAPASENGSGAPTPNGRLVFNAKDLFIQRGYVVSPDTVSVLQQYLHTLWNTLNAPSPGWKDGIAEMAKKSGKTAPMLMDLLQNTDGHALPRLPKGLPEWSRKDLRELQEPDVSEVFKFVARYLSKVDVVAKEVARQREANENNCSLLYLSEEQLGLQ